jgi:Flp pilus assembly protein TadG
MKTDQDNASHRHAKLPAKGGTNRVLGNRRFRDLLQRFRDDRSGNYLVITALATPALLGLVGLGTENGLWLYTHQSLQSAADVAAFSAAQSYAVNGSGSPVAGQNPNLVAEANAIAARYGYTNGQNGATVTVNRPPRTGAHSTLINGVEVIISQTQPRLFSALWNKNNVTITGRSVAMGGVPQGCVLALDGTLSGAATASGSTAVNLKNCDLYDDSNNATALNGNGSAVVQARQVGVVGGATGTSNFVTTMGLLTGFPIVPDPYASVNFPSFSGCDKTNFSAKTTTTISPGVYCKGMQFNAGADVTFSPGVYYIDRGDLTINGGASVHGTGVTIVLTSSTASSYATVTINGGATVNLTAPNSGTLSGIVVFGDRKAPTGTSYKFNGGSGQVYGGAVYLPKGDVQWAGGASTSTNCTQVIGDTITFTGNSDLTVNCTGFGTKPLGLNTALVE